MKNKLKSISRTLKNALFPYAPSKEEKIFIEENIKHWKKSVNLPGIIVETSLSTPASLMEKLLIAKILEDKIGSATLCLIPGIYKQASEAYLVANSFGVVNFNYFWRNYFNPAIVLKCISEFITIIKKIRTGEELIKLKIDGVHVGDLLYDTLIRYLPNTYTVDNIIVKKHGRLIFRAIYNFHVTSKIFEKNKIKAVVTSHNVYAEFGILARLASKNEAVVYLKDMDVFRVYHKNENICEHFLRIDAQELNNALNDSDIVKKADVYFEKRLKGDISQVDLNNAYVDKKVYEKNEFIEKFKLNSENKNIFIMAHAFSDAPHVGGGLVFEDYYVWLRDTILVLSKNKRINVFVKPHPSSYMWGEIGAVEKLLNDMNISNIHITPKDMSTLSLKNIANCLVTARGTAGLEYSGFGIPVLTCGDGFYSNFGISIDNRSREEYINSLNNIDSFKQLSPQVSQKARVLLYLTFNKLQKSSIAPSRHIYPGDDFNKIKPLHYKEMTDNLRKNGSYLDEFTAKIFDQI